MNSQQIKIFEFPSNLGLKKTETAVEPGVRFLPAWLKKHGLYDAIGPKQIFNLEAPEYSMEQDLDSGVRNAEKIIHYSEDQAALLMEHLRTDSFLLLIGGDCSMLIGTAMALKQSGTYGLFYLDGHTDFIWPELSHTGGAAGMDLAIVTGYGHEKLANILDLKPYLTEQHIWCVGNREYDPAYIKPILDSQIRYVDLKSLRERGLESCAAQFLEIVEINKLDGFFIHFDVDVLNDRIMPAVDSREADGLEYEELDILLGTLLASPKAMGMEITILDPDLDQDGKYTRGFISAFMHTWRKALNETGRNSASV
ncbi:MAG: arginase family protein [Prolixibacteraceae bacterium]